MHLNSHYALGTIISSITHYFFHFNLIEYVLIICCAFLNDFDVFFSKYAKDHNHRNLITHSIIPGTLILILGILLVWPALIIGGIAYLSHILVDTFDWGVNLFYFPKKTYGMRLLMTDEEDENLDEILSHYKNKEAFFDQKYYNNRLTLSIEISLFILMMISVILFAFEYLWLTLIYFVGVYFHLSRHRFLTKAEKAEK